MIMKSASEKGTYFYLSFKTENEFIAKNLSLIEIAKMLRMRPDKVKKFLFLAYASIVDGYFPKRQLFNHRV